MPKQNNPLADILQQIQEAVEGGEYQYEAFINPALKGKLTIECKKMNYILIDQFKTNRSYLVTWIGSKSWYKAQTGKSSYDRVKVGKQIISSLQETLGIQDNAQVTFLNPNVVAKFSKVEDGSGNGDDEIACDNLNNVINAIMPIVTKLK